MRTAATPFSSERTATRHARGIPKPVRHDTAPNQGDESMFDCIRTRNARSRATHTLAAVFIIAAAFVTAYVTPALAIGTGFSYQGQLKKNSAPYTGSADLTFKLFDAASGGSQVGSTVTQAGVLITGGLFTTQLDFGSVFDGTQRFLEITAATSGDPTVLTPRQEIKPVPYAVRAENGGTGGSQWTTSGTTIFYNGGHVGIGISNPITKLQVDSGTENTNAAFFDNNNSVFPCFGSRNVAPNGIGYYDEWSARHFITGRLGIGTLAPEAKIHIAGGEKFGVKATASGGGAGPISTAIWGIGDGSAFSGPAVGVYGQSDWGDGVQGVTSSSAWYGGYFDNTGGGTALFADGLAQIRTLQILGGADLVEGFDARGDAESGAKPDAGTVLVIDEKNEGGLCASTSEYDRRVAGVVSGANGVEHGIKLGQSGALDGETPVAMTGRVYVKCSTENGPIRPGDLLTTSTTSGHAMRATDHARANGAVIGKAMSSLGERTGLVLVLVNLQ